MTTIDRYASLEMIDTFFDWLEILQDPAQLMDEPQQAADMMGQVADFMTLFQQDDVAMVVKDRCMWPTDPTTSVEAKCVRCKETFQPHDPADFIHYQRDDGNECGGFGLPMGSWR